MGTSLTGTTPQDTYDSLIKVTDNGPLSSTAKYVSDGLGTDSPLSLSTTSVGIGTDTPTQKLHVSGNIRVTGAYYDSNNSAGTTGQVLKSTGTGVEWGSAASGVTSVGLSAPTGFSVSGSPVTSSGTLALSFASGYSLPTTANQTNWTTAYNDSIVSAAVAGTTTKTLTLTQQDGGTITASWSDYDTAPVSSVFGRTGAVVAVSGDYSTDLVTEATNLYYTDARSRAAISSSATGLSYSSSTGVFSLTSGYSIPTTANQTNWTTAYNDSIVSAAVAGTTTKTLTLTQQDGGTITASWSDYDTAPVTSVNGQTGVVVLDTDDVSEGATNLYYTDARARGSVSAGTGISYNSSTGVITNSAPDQTVALTGGTGISTSGTYPNFTITNTSPDKTVVLTAGTGISTSGVYPNFSIANTAPDQVVSLTADTAISITGSYPSFTIKNTAPDKTVSLTASTGISTSGTYPNFTIENTAPDKTVSLSAGSGISISGTYPNFGIANTDGGSALSLTAGSGISISGSYPSFTIDNTGPTGSNPSGTSFFAFWKTSSQLASAGGMYYNQMNQYVGLGTLSPQAQFVISAAGNTGIEFAGYNSYWGTPAMSIYNRGTSSYTEFTVESAGFNVYDGSNGQTVMKIKGGMSGGFSMDNGSNFYYILGGYSATPQICSGYITIIINGTPYKIMIA